MRRKATFAIIGTGKVEGINKNDPIRDEDTLFVCLEFRDELEGDCPTGLNFYPFHKAFWNPSRGQGAILGIGQPGSYEYAWQKHREWREEYFGDPGRVLQRLQGKTPYRRSPYSLVGNGFMVMGDAGFQTKPFSGEGVTSSFTACQVAAEVAAPAFSPGPGTVPDVGGGGQAAVGGDVMRVA